MWEIMQKCSIMDYFICTNTSRIPISPHPLHMLMCQIPQHNLCKCVDGPLYPWICTVHILHTEYVHLLNCNSNHTLICRKKSTFFCPQRCVRQGAQKKSNQYSPDAWWDGTHLLQQSQLGTHSIPFYQEVCMYHLVGGEKWNQKSQLIKKKMTFYWL